MFPQGTAVCGPFCILARWAWDEGRGHGLCYPHVLTWDSFFRIPMCSCVNHAPCSLTWPHAQWSDDRNNARCILALKTVQTLSPSRYQEGAYWCIDPSTKAVDISPRQPLDPWRTMAVFSRGTISWGHNDSSKINKLHGLGKVTPPPVPGHGADVKGTKQVSVPLISMGWESVTTTRQ